MKKTLPIAGLVLAAMPVAAIAHVAFEAPEASRNASYKAIVKIGHGCDGSPTKSLRISIPEGVIAVKPMPKAGWTLATTRGAYARTYDHFGKPMAEGVKEITWSGGSLPDDQYDEFTFQARMTDALPAGSALYVPVVQTCEKGEHAWTEVPAAGQDAHALKSPAPAILIRDETVKMAQAQHHHHGHGAAAAPAASGVTISPAWSRATPPGAKVAGGYVTVENKGSAADRLIGGSSEISNVFEVHEMAMDGGVMKMRALDKGLDIAPGGKIEMKPGGYHIMFLDLKRPLKEGESFTGELVFEKAGKVPVTFKVMPIGSTGGGHSHH